MLPEHTVDLRLWLSGAVGLGVLFWLAVQWGAVACVLGIGAPLTLECSQPQKYQLISLAQRNLLHKFSTFARPIRVALFVAQKQLMNEFAEIDVALEADKARVLQHVKRESSLLTTYWSEFNLSSW